MIIAVAETIGFAAIQTSSSKNYSYREGCCVCLEMARSFFFREPGLRDCLWG